MTEEPSVLDYVKSKLAFWKRSSSLDEYIAANLPGQPAGTAADRSALAGPDTGVEIEVAEGSLKAIQGETVVAAQPVKTNAGVWWALLALFLALLAQISLEPRPERTWVTGLLFYIIAAGLALLSSWRGAWQLAEPPPDQERIPDMVVRSRFLFPAALLGGAALLAFRGDYFNSLNLFLWLAGIFALLLAFWRFDSIPQLWAGTRRFLANPSIHVRVSGFSILVLAAILAAIFFRTYLLAEVPNEMVSDHAEKLYDVRDLLNGETRIYFPRNTGREFFQMYLTAWVIETFQTGLSFISLKIGTVLLGLLTLPFIYLLGVEMGSRRVGLMAFAFAGIAYWPNLISRIALRFTLYPFFYAPALYFLLRGLRTKNINNFILSGLFMGLGLHGYSPYRMVPVVAFVAVMLYILHTRSVEARKQALYGITVTAITAFFVFIPLFTYSLQHPEVVLYRSMTRVGTLEQAIPGNPLAIFLKNNLAALSMFAWDNGEVWVISVVHRPILDIVSAALFHLGAILVLFRYIRQRHWQDLLILVSIPILLLPSTLSIAFPAENPSLNRTAAALVPAFLLVGICLDGLLNALHNFGLGKHGSRIMVFGVGIFLFFIAAMQNYDLVFNQYETVYRQSSWNTSEIGGVVKDFSHLVGTSETAWLVAYPHWVDSRLVMINAGYPERDNALSPEHFGDTLAEQRAKLFLLNIQAEAHLRTLQTMYPKGWLQRYSSHNESKDFWMFFVPPVDQGFSLP